MADAPSIDTQRTSKAAPDDSSAALSGDDGAAPAVPEVREAKDAEHHKALKRDPSDADSKLEIGLDESFPTSDPPANSLPGSADPAPSSGFDEAAEAKIAREREEAK